MAFIRQKYGLTWTNHSDGYETVRMLLPVAYPDGHYVSSQVVDEFLPSARVLDGAHAPVFDIDREVHLVPSSTPGHFHLYCPQPTTWRRYKKAMKAMAKAGIVDPEWVRLSIARKFGLVRRQPLD